MSASLGDRRPADILSGLVELAGKSEAAQLAAALDFDEAAFHLAYPECPEDVTVGDLATQILGAEFPEIEVARAIAGDVEAHILLDGLDFLHVQTLSKLLSWSQLPGRARREVRLLGQRYARALSEVHRIISARSYAHQIERKALDVDVSNLAHLGDMVRDLNDIAIEIAYLERSMGKATDGSAQIAAAVTELMCSIEEIAQSCVRTRQQTEMAQHAVDAMQHTVGGVAASMDAINDSSNRAQSEVSELAAAFDQITNVLAVIDTIAKQTNLLALNATIEAARAGESGRGFAVVAAEVKQLAQQTGGATLSIGHQIEALRDVISRIGQAMSLSQKAVEDGQTAVAKATGIASEILASSSGVTQSISEITAVIEQQSQASSIIAKDASDAADLARQGEDLLQSMNSKLQSGNDRLAGLARTWFRSSSAQSLCEMAKIDHVLFRKRAVDAVMNKGDWKASAVPDHHSCRLGKWYDSLDDRRLKALSAYVSLETPHQRVHAAAKAALEHHEMGRHDKALEELSRLYEASKEVIANLGDLSSAIVENESQSDRRSTPREEVMSIGLLFDRQRMRNVGVRDVSDGGAGLVGVSKVDVGKAVRLLHAAQCCGGQLMWADGNTGGMKFEAQAVAR
ncbi:methyl-accepting chemotaxis protein [Oryzibacter oryziterrae]|uniref:methyl-accepting chemotaxis protein n=1 Tax=Oryzibacter oryziterrae TaxID=2766474 RepID=UPI001F01EDFA|nr:methyl-accepting chemotaxis protein [Oryzibacter oryziterrae]